MKTKNIIYLLGFFAMVFLAVSCADEEIDWETEDAPSMLVVEGSFTNELKRHEIILRESANYFSNQPTPVISNAIVTISDGETVYDFVEEEPGSGIYLSEDSVAGVPGKRYTLNIELSEPLNGSVQFSAAEMLNPGINLDSATAMLYENPFYLDDGDMDSLFLIVNAYGMEPKDVENFYRVDLYRNGELLMDTIDEVEVYSDQDQFSGGYLHSLAFMEGIGIGDTVTIEINSVSEDYQYFITGIQNIANQSGNPFDMSGPPANAIGNIQGGNALGFFRVSYVSASTSQVIDMRETE